MRNRKAVAGDGPVLARASPLHLGHSRDPPPSEPPDQPGLRPVLHGGRSWARIWVAAEFCLPGTASCAQDSLVSHGIFRSFSHSPLHLLIPLLIQQVFTDHLLCVRPVLGTQG